MAGTGGAGTDAGGDAVDLGNVRVFNAVDAEGALLHHALGGVHLAGAVGAGPGAEAAADAVLLVDEDDAVLGALEAGAGGADGDARGVGAVEAGLGEVDDPGRAGVGDGLEAVDVVEEGAIGVGAVGVAVGEGREAAARRVPFLAGDDAGVAADAGVEVDDEAERPFGRSWQGGHARPGKYGKNGAGIRVEAGWNPACHLAGSSSRLGLPGPDHRGRRAARKGPPCRARRSGAVGRVSDVSPGSRDGPRGTRA